MSSLGVSTTIEQDNRHSSLIFRAVTKRRLAGVTLQTRLTELEATAESITSIGDLGGYNPRTLHLTWDRIRELHFAPSGAGEIGGLYAREGALCSRCILPRLSEVQVGELIGALVARFPHIMRTIEIDLDLPRIHFSGQSYRRPATSLNLLPQKPTLQPYSLSHALNRATRSLIGREHESARRIHRRAAGPL